MKFRKNQPLISVIILNYQKPQDSLTAITSVKRQTYQNYEVILVDDCSKDDSVRQIEDKHPDIKLVKLKKSLGRAGWNEGMKVAQGSIFLLLDADMFLAKSFLKRLAGKVMKFPRLAVFAFDLRDPKGKTSWEPVHLKAKTSENGFEAFTATVALRREVFDRVGGFNPDFFLYVEYEYYIRLLLFGYRVVYFPNLIAYHADSSNPYRSTMLGYHVVKNHWQLYALHLPLRVWPRFLRHHRQEFVKTIIKGRGASRWGTVKGLIFGLYFFFKALSKRNRNKVLQGPTLRKFLRFYFPKKGDVVIKKWGWR